MGGQGNCRRHRSGNVRRRLVDTMHESPGTLIKTTCLEQVHRTERLTRGKSPALWVNPAVIPVSSRKGRFSSFREGAIHGGDGSHGNSSLRECVRGHLSARTDCNQALRLWGHEVGQGCHAARTRSEPGNRSHCLSFIRVFGPLPRQSVPSFTFKEEISNSANWKNSFHLWYLRGGGFVEVWMHFQRFSAEFLKCRSSLWSHSLQLQFLLSP